MAVRGRMDLANYDRLFPSQDVLPSGDVGNLIAAPLNGKARPDAATVFARLSAITPAIRDTRRRQAALVPIAVRDVQPPPRTRKRAAFLLGGKVMATEDDST